MRPGRRDRSCATGGGATGAAGGGARMRGSGGRPEERFTTRAPARRPRRARRAECGDGGSANRGGTGRGRADTEGLLQVGPVGCRRLLVAHGREQHRFEVGGLVSVRRFRSLITRTPHGREVARSRESIGTLRALFADATPQSPAVSRGAPRFQGWSGPRSRRG